MTSTFPFAQEDDDADGYLVVRTEGGDFEWLSYGGWLKTVPYVPIFGVLRQGRAVIYDRILETLGHNPWRETFFNARREPIDPPTPRILHKVDADAMEKAAAFRVPEQVVQVYLDSLSDKSRLNLARALTYPGVK